METQICKKCGRELLITEFNWANKAKGKRQQMCRKCFSEYNKARYAKNPDKYKQDVKTYKKNNPKKVLETRLSTNKKHPTKQNAQKCVDAALIAGVIVRPDHCYGCGCSSDEHRIEAHHHDYSKPLDIVWLCTSCHRKLDNMRAAREKPSRTTGKKRVVCVETSEVYDSIVGAAKDKNCRRTAISACIESDYETAGGYHWRYA